MRLHDYLTRIGIVNGTAQGTPQWLRRLHVGHRETFLFENLSIQTGGGVSVALDAVERKFLDERRGGYCFEHNTLFAAALRESGFAVQPLLGRVRRGPPERWGRTHMVLHVTAQDGSTFLADVGFGAIGLVEPIPFSAGAAPAQRGIEYALRREQHLWILSMTDASQTMDLYEFGEDPQTVGDIIIANHYTATHPDSIFRKTLTIQRVRGDDRIVLRNETVSRWRSGRLTEEMIDRAQLPEAARDLFGVQLPEGPFLYEVSERAPAL